MTHGPNSHVPGSQPASGRLRAALRAGLIGALLLLLALIYLALNQSGAATSAPREEATIQAVADALSSVPVVEPGPEEAPAAQAPTVVRTVEGGGLVYQGWDGLNRHLFALAPGALRPVQLTNGSFDDADPAVSPSGDQIAFRSQRDGNWELYLLSLADGSLQRLTRTPYYEGHPTWSPDGRWLAYEAYADGDLDIWIMAIDGSQPPIQLTNHPGLDASPHWDPSSGRRIAFISNRDGSADVFLADLDRPVDRFRNLTQSVDWAESDPSFAPDGSRLAYSTQGLGLDLLWTIDAGAFDGVPIQIGPGRAPVWSADSQALIASLPGPQATHLVGYGATGQSLAFGLTLAGMGPAADWLPVEFASLPTAPSTAGQDQPPVATEPTGEAGKMSLIALENVTAPNARLVTAAEWPFRQLRSAIESAAGWDFLGTLDSAFVGLNDPLPPGYALNDWLYTGRAFAFREAAWQQDLVEVVREEIGGQTYWRVFVRAAAQDGSLGQPLPAAPWDFNARHLGNPSDYDQGGRVKDPIPTGYYVDFTALAAALGFERQPSLNNWRTFYLGARYNEFAFTQGLSWLQAMLDLYPAEAIATPTAFSSPTPTPSNTPRPTATPWWWLWRTPTPSAEASPTTAPSP